MVVVAVVAILLALLIGILTGGSERVSDPSDPPDIERGLFPMNQKTGGDNYGYSVS